MTLSRPVGWLAFVLAFAVLPGFSLLEAQPLLTLEEALVRAQNNPVYLAKQQLVESSRVLVGQANRRPNPVLESDLETGAPFGDGSDHVISLALVQPWERGGKRALRTRIAESELEEAELDLLEYANMLAASVKTTYFELLHLAEKEALISSHSQRLQDLLDYDEVRFQAGETAALNLDYLRTEVARMALERERVLNESQRVRYQLNTLLGQDLDSEFTLSDEAGEVALPALPRIIDFAARHRPYLRLLESRLGRAQLEIARQRAIAKPDWEVGLGYHRTSSDIDGNDFRPPLSSSARDSSNLLEFTLKIPLPLWDDNAGNIAAAIHSEKAAVQELASGRALVTNIVTTSYREAELNRSLLKTYDGALLRQLEESGRREIAAYRLTAEDILDLLDGQRELLDAQLARAEAAFEARRSIVTLEAGSGGSLSEIDGTN